MVVRFGQQCGLTLVLSMALAHSAQAVVLLSENFEGSPDPNDPNIIVFINPDNNLDPNGALSFPGYGIWYNSVAEANDDSLSTRNRGGSRTLRVGVIWDGCAVNYAIDPNVATWDSSLDYTLSFKLILENNYGPQNPLIVRARASSDLNGVLRGETIVAEHNAGGPYTYLADVTIVVPGYQIASAGLDGQAISIEFFHTSQWDPHYIDDVELSTAAASIQPTSATTGYNVLVTTPVSNAVQQWEVFAGNWTRLDNFAGPGELVAGVGELKNPQGLTVNPGTGRVYVAEADAAGFVYEFESDGTLTTNGFFNDGIVADAGFDFSGVPASLTISPDGDLYMAVSEVAADPNIPGNNAIYALDLATYDLPLTQVIPQTDGTNYSLNGVQGIAFGSNGDLYVCNRGPFDGILDPNIGDQIIRFDCPGNLAPCTFVEVLYDQINRPSGIIASGSTLYVTAPEAVLEFTDVSDPNQLILNLDFQSGNPWDVEWIGNGVYITNESSNRIDRVGQFINQVEQVVTGTTDARGLATLDTFSVSLWDGEGANDNWSTALNWLGDTTPDFLNQADLLFTGNARLTPNNNIVGADLKAIRFDALAGAFSISGNSLTTPFVVNNSSNEQIFSTDLVSADPNGAIAFSGNGETTVLGEISGSGGVAVNGGTLNLRGANTYAGETTIAGGVVVANNAASLGSDTARTYHTGLANGGRLELVGGITLTEPIALNNNNSNAYSGRQIDSKGDPNDPNSLTLTVNELAGPLSIVGTTTAIHYVFAADANAELLISGPVSSTANAIWTHPRTRGDGTVHFTGDWSGYLNTGEKRYFANSGTTVFNTSASLSPLPWVQEFEVSTGAVVELIDSGRSNTLPNCTLIDVDGILDVTGLMGGGLVLDPDSNPNLIGTNGVILGSVTTGGPNNSIDAGNTLTFANGLDMSAGVTLALEVGGNGDTIIVSGGTLTGSSSPGGITVNAESGGTVAAGSYVLIDFTNAAGTSDLSVDDFTLNTSFPGLQPVLKLTSTQLLLNFVETYTTGAIWTEPFDYVGDPGASTSTLHTIDNYGWQNAFNSTGQMFPTGLGTSGTIGVAGVAGADGDIGYLLDNHATNNRNFWFPDPNGINPVPDFPLSDLNEIRFSVRNNPSGQDPFGAIGLAVQIAGEWYRTPITYNSPDSSTWTEQVVTTADLTSSGTPLQRIDFVPDFPEDPNDGPGVLNGLDSVIPDLTPTGSDTVTNIGFYTYQRLQIRIDEISIIGAGGATIVRFDFDNDMDIDAADADVFFGCLSGPDNATVPQGCSQEQFDRSDADGDGDVDMDDYSVCELQASLLN